MLDDNEIPRVEKELGDPCSDEKTVFTGTFKSFQLGVSRWWPEIGRSILKETEAPHGLLRY